ncbi:hypothetical protein ONZ45_g14432 [Pleurotus djamor]|nr:hypothetical protein ONZ45_g14432 [Pleurotus djamor]
MSTQTQYIRFEGTILPYQIVQPTGPELSHPGTLSENSPYRTQAKEERGGWNLEVGSRTSTTTGATGIRTTYEGIYYISSLGCSPRAPACFGREFYQYHAEVPSWDEALRRYYP